ncbi:MAG: ABC transporter ATP-binding protein [Bdellovibrionales bacterium]
MNSDLLLQVRSVSKSFVQGTNRIEVLKNLELSVRKGETVAILGESGSGKSTLLSLLAGLDKPDKGNILIDSFDISQMSEAELTNVRGQLLGMVFQQYHLIPSLNALENISLPLDIQKQVDAEVRSKNALAQVGLSHRASHLPHQMSGGECQRVAIARAIVPRPLLLLADEPSGNLDVNTGTHVLDMMFDIIKTNHMTALFVTHSEEVARRCQRRVHLKNGQLV